MHVYCIIYPEVHLRTVRLQLERVPDIGIKLIIATCLIKALALTGCCSNGTAVKQRLDKSHVPAACLFP